MLKNIAKLEPVVKVFWDPPLSVEVDTDVVGVITNACSDCGRESCAEGSSFCFASPREDRIPQRKKLGTTNRTKDKPKSNPDSRSRSHSHKHNEKKSTPDRRGHAGEKKSECHYKNQNRSKSQSPKKGPTLSTHGRRCMMCRQIAISGSRFCGPECRSRHNQSSNIRKTLKHCGICDGMSPSSVCNKCDRKYFAVLSLS